MPALQTIIGEIAAAQELEPTVSQALEQYRAAARDRVSRELPQLSRLLAQMRVARVEIAYDGCGDSGQIEELQYLNAHGERVAPSIAEADEEKLTQFFYDLLEMRYPGWENNDGAFGEFSWDVAADTLHHTHNMRFTDYQTEEHDGL